jgi:HMG-box domain
MIYCYNQPITAELTLSSLRVVGFQNVEAMSSGYQHILDEADSGTNDQSTDLLAGPLDEVKSTEHHRENRPKPKRPLSAYNWFFHSERQNILDETPIRKEGKPRRSHGKIGFADLARSIAAKWKGLSREDRAAYDEKATIDKDRYLREMEEWKKWQSVAVSQLPPHSTDAHRDLMSFPNDTFNVSAIVSHPSFYSRDSLDQAPSAENVLSNEMKTASRDFFSTESYSLSDIFGAELTRRLQSPSNNVSLTTPPATGSVARRTSPNIRSLASQLGDESTELFLDLFRDPDCS